MNFFKLHTGDWEAATAHLTWDQEAAYFRLIKWYYRDERPLPNELPEIFRKSRAVTPAHQEAVISVLAEFFILKGNAYHNKRCNAEIAAFKKQASINKKIAKERESKKRYNDAHEPCTNRARTVHGARKSREPTHNPLPTHPLPISQEPEPNTPQPPAVVFTGESGRGRAGRLPPASEVRGVFETIDAELLRAMPGAAIQRACVFVGLNPRTAAKAANRKDLTVDGFMREYESILTDERLENPLGILASRLQLSHPSRGGK